MLLKTTWAQLNSLNSYYLIGYMEELNSQCMELKTGRLSFINDDTLLVTCTRHGEDHKAMVLAEIKFTNSHEYVDDLTEEEARFYEFDDQDYLFVDKNDWAGWILKDAVEELVMADLDFLKNGYLLTD